MVHAIRQEITVQQANMIQIHSPELKPGAHVEVILLLDEERKSLPKKGSLRALMGAGKGSFSTAEQADSFIRGERDKWE